MPEIEAINAQIENNEFKVHKRNLNGFLFLFENLYFTVKVKVKQRQSCLSAQLIKQLIYVPWTRFVGVEVSFTVHHPDARWRWWIRLTPWLLYPWGWSPIADLDVVEQNHLSLLGTEPWPPSPESIGKVIEMPQLLYNFCVIQVYWAKHEGKYVLMLMLQWNPSTKLCSINLTDSVDLITT